MKFALGMLSLVHQVASMQVSVAPDAEVDLVQDVQLNLNDDEFRCDPFDGCGTEVDLSKGNPVTNNFDGQGPGEGPKEIRFKNAGTVKCQDVDLVLKATSKYTPGQVPPIKNGGQNGFGMITLAAGTSTGVELSIVDSSTGAPVSVDEFTIWVYDLDTGKRGNGKEYVKVCDADAQALDPAPDMTREDDGSCSTFTALKKGSESDNPTDRNALTDLQRKRSLKATFAGTDKALVTVGLGPGGSGRGFQFTATAKTLCTTTTTTTTPPYSTPKPRPVDPNAPCQDANGGKNCSVEDLCNKGVEIAFFKHNIIVNNLGGIGPDHGKPPVLHYTKVAQDKGRDLDLIVSVSDAYYRANHGYRALWTTGDAWCGKENGVAGGGAGEIGTLARAEFDVTFSLVYTDDQQPAVVENWDMTYYDLDGNYESVDTCDAVSAVLYKKTAMQGPGCSNGCCKMKGARAEYREPSNWENMSPYYKEDAVSFIFKDQSKATFHYKSTGEHRVWFFKGSKVMACGDMPR